MVFAQKTGPRSAPRPRWAPPSRFVTACLSQIAADGSGVAGDFGAGYGRNTFATAMRGWNTVALDLDRTALTSLMARYAMHRDAISGHISAICADLSQHPPMRPASFALGMLIEYSVEINLNAAVSAIDLDGYIIMETFGDRGENWRGLPRPGELKALLEGEFDLLSYNEKACRHAGEARCTAKVFGRRIRHPK